ncbi:MAG: hypothetical protein JW987_07100 [Anaerolineaceae bacterium]|nr:hypothetical protein [Anaerolineaceae bacterium]
MSEQQIQSVIRNTQRRWFDDGLWEIAFGTANLFLGLYFLLVTWLNLDENLGAWMAALQIVVVLVVFGGMRYGVPKLKERFTYPRTGYASFRRPERSERRRKAFWRGMLSGGVAAAVATVVGLANAVNLAPGVTALIFAGMCFYLSFRMGIQRFAVLGLLTLTTGFILTQLRLDVDSSMAVLFIAFGTLCALLGVIALITFLRRTRPITEEEL